MNTDQDRFARRLALIQANGLCELRKSALKGLKLKTVIKESHCSPVQQLSFNLCDDNCCNLFATVAKDQATVYNDQHMADHVAVVAHLSLSNATENCKDTFSCCCWVNSTGISSHPYGDALLAIAGSHPFINIISVVEAAVVAQLPVPPGCVVADLSAASHCPGLLLSLCKDGTLQLWQVLTGQCCWSCRTDAFTAVLHPAGHYAVSSSRNGKLSKWTGLQHVLEVAAAAAGSDIAAGTAATAAAAVVKAPLLLQLSGSEGSVADCMRFLSADQLATKTADGYMAVHAMPSGQQLSSWRVPGCSNSAASYSSRCCFSHTRDGQYICVGNHNTTAYVFDASTGSQVARVEAIRVQGSVRACGLSEDCRHLSLVVGSGYIFRFEYRPPAEDDEQLSQEDTDRDDSEEAEGLQADGDAEMTDTIDMGQQQQQLQPLQQLPKHQGQVNPHNAAHPSKQQHQQATAADMHNPASAATQMPAADPVPAAAGCNPDCSSIPLLHGIADSTQHRQQQQQQPVLVSPAAAAWSELTPGLTPPATTAALPGGLGPAAGTAATSGLPPPHFTPSGGLMTTGSQDSWHKRQRLDVAAAAAAAAEAAGSILQQHVDTSPLIFRPTP